MKFGVGFPTAMEGMMYPIPLADAAFLRDLAQTSEGLGYEAIWGNDHLSTQGYVREEFQEPPNFFEPLACLSYVAGVTSTIRLATGILVLPFRHPVMVAKQLATLDHLSSGRLTVGVGIGAYREEFEALHPDGTLHRGQYAEESLLALEELFTQRRAGFDGRWIRFSDVESFPKPLQSPLPILSGGNSAGSKQRAGRLAQGWLPACLTPDEVATGIAEVRDVAAGANRTLGQDFEFALQVGVRVAPSRQQAIAEFESSQMQVHIASLTASTLKGQEVAEVVDRSLVGTPEDIAERVAEYRDAGVTNLAGLLFAASDAKDLMSQVQVFGESVLAPSPSTQDA